MTADGGTTQRSTPSRSGEVALSDWRRVPITECGEPLSQVLPGSKLLVEPIYRHLGYENALDRIFLRDGVIERLRQAAQALPLDFALLIWDGWRPEALQADLYRVYRERIEAESRLHGRELDDLVEKFVSVPSSDPGHPSPHLTGGAVDLTLVYVREPVDMGSEFDELSDRSRTNYYDHDRTSSGAAVRRRRRLLLSVMHDAGFTNFASEWWHFDYGNQFWAHASGREAIYGRVSPQAI